MTRMARHNRYPGRGSADREERKARDFFGNYSAKDIRVNHAAHSRWHYQLTRIKFIFAWYDFWVGIYWDQKNHRLYFLPLPMLGIMLEFRKFYSYR